MDWSGLSTILPLGATGFALALMYVCIRIAFAQRRLADETLSRLRAEITDRQEDRKRQQTELDAERARTDAERGLRRVAEEKMDELLRRVRGLEAHVVQLEQRVVELTVEVTGSGSQ